MNRHGFIRGAECSIGNSGIPFNEGFNYYACACGKWREACKGDKEGLSAYRRHMETELEQADALAKVNEQ